MPDRSAGRGRRRARRWAAAAVGGAVALVGLSEAVAASGASGPAYRTAPVSLGTVEQTLDATGTISPVSQAALAFPVSGRVAGVAVTAGQHVSPGQVLARMGTTSLLAQVSQEQAAVAAAQAKLAEDRASEDQTSQSAVRPAAARVLGGGPYQPPSLSRSRLSLLLFRSLFRTPLPRSKDADPRRAHRRRTAPADAGRTDRGEGDLWAAAVLVGRLRRIPRRVEEIRSHPPSPTPKRGLKRFGTESGGSGSPLAVRLLDRGQLSRRVRRVLRCVGAR